MSKFEKKIIVFGDQKGFSLVELMVVVAIIGILSALAIPRFRVFQAKARQAEAKTNLSHIYTLQLAYHGDEDTYVAITPTGWNTACPGNPLGFEINPCARSRYQYTTSGIGTNTFTSDATSGSGTANEILPGCNADQWRINQDKTMTTVRDVTRNC